LRGGLDAIVRLLGRRRTFWQRYDGNDVEESIAVTLAGFAINWVRLFAALIWPYKPHTSEKLNRMLAAEPLLIPNCWMTTDSLEPGHVVSGYTEDLFPMVDEGMVELLRSKLAGHSAS